MLLAGLLAVACGSSGASATAGAASTDASSAGASSGGASGSSSTGASSASGGTATAGASSGASSGGASSGSAASTTTTSSSSGGPTPPPQASDAGYTLVTFGPNPSLTQWFTESFFGEHPAGAYQNPDGTMYLGCDAGWLDNDGGLVAEVVTAKQDSSKPNDWSGLAFGGGGYFQVVYSFANGTNGYAAKDTLAFWANDIENMSGSTHYDLFANWLELDIMEFDASSGSASAQAITYGHSLHNWYGVRGAGDKVDPPALLTPASAPDTWQNDNTFGLLWVPATATTQGYVTYYNNDQVVGGPIYWDQYTEAELAASPPDGGNRRPNFGNRSDGGVAPYSGGAMLDHRHISMILTAGTCMEVKSTTVWQATTANNLTE